MSNIERAQRPECDGIYEGCTRLTESTAFIKRADNYCTEECLKVQNYGNQQVTSHELTLTFVLHTDDGKLNQEVIVDAIEDAISKPEELVIQETNRATARLLATDKEVTV